MPDLTVDEFLAHHGVKGMKWGVRKDQPPPMSATEKLLAHPAVQLAKGTKEGNAANLAITAAGIAAVAASAPVSAPILIGGTVSARIAIKSYEAYKMFYQKHPSKLLPKPNPDRMARLKTGSEMRKQLLKEHGSKKL